RARSQRSRDRRQRGAEGLMAAEDDVFDVIVIGGGPPGVSVVERVVRGGLTASLVEERLVGGGCQYFACVPSKALLRPLGPAAGGSPEPRVEPGRPVR